MYYFINYQFHFKLFSNIKPFSFKKSLFISEPGKTGDFQNVPARKRPDGSHQDPTSTFNSWKLQYPSGLYNHIDYIY